MSKERATWREAWRDAREAAAEAWAYHVSEGEPGYASDLAHEYADGDADVIYTHRAREVWMDASEVQAYEEEADGFAPGAWIDRRITLCVYLAIRAAFAEAYEELDNIDAPEYALVVDDQAIAFGEMDDLDDVRMGKANPNAYRIVKPSASMLQQWAAETANEVLGLRGVRA